MAISGMTAGIDSLHRKAVSVRGNADEIGASLLERVFEENPYMAEIYPEPESRTTLTVFQVRHGQGEYFDLSTKPITREIFFLGGHGEKTEDVSRGGYFITDGCHGCRLCYSKCPQKCITLGQIPYVIQQEHCLRCGNCMEACPFNAVERR